MKTVVFGLLGTTLDRGHDTNRWENWRPTVSLCQHEDLLIQRLELLYERKFKSLADTVAGDIQRVSPETEVVHHLVEFKDPWDFEEVYGTLHDFARKYHFDPEQEQYLFHITTGTHVAQICIFLLTESRYFPGKIIQSSPPKRKDSGQPGEYAVIDLDLSKYDKIAMRFKQEAKDDISFLKSGIETRNAAFNSLIEQIEKVALRTPDPILLMGPTGAGKSLLARRINELKKTRGQFNGNFIEVNCATLRGDLMQSTLFGHKKGSFTGATVDREGLLRASDGGMLFMDEIGELGPDEQAMLLRAIEEKHYFPMGSDKEVKSDFQLICGTNHDLYEDVRQGRFREDLLARINLWTFTLPSLRERPEDIEPNVQYELDRFAEKHGTRVTFNKEARDRFLSFATSPPAKWTTNFRDLNNSIIRMATLAAGGRVTSDIVEEEIARLGRTWGNPKQDPDRDILWEVLGAERAAHIDEFDRVQLAEVIRVCRASRNLSEAGRTLYSVSRGEKKTSNDADRLRKYLARFGLEWSQIDRT